MGFIALLKSKIYLDQDTKEKVQIDIPIFGKFKSNVPSLAFLFLGAFLLW